MTDSVDFKAAKEWARRTVRFCEYWATGGEPSKTYGGTYDCAKGFLALCELLGQAAVAVENASENADSREATRKMWSELLERINAAIGA